MTVYSGYSVYLRLLSYVQAHWFKFFLGVISTILLALSDSTILWLFRPLLDKGFIAKDIVFIHWLPLIIIFLFLLRSIAGFGSNYYLASVSRQLTMEIRQQIFKHLLQLPASFYDHSTSGRLLSILIYNVEQITIAGIDALVTLVQESFFIMGLIVVIVSASWQLSLLFFITLPLIFWITQYSSKRMRQLSQNTQNLMAETTQVAEEAIDGYRVIRIFGGERYETERFDQAIEKNRLYEIKLVVTKSFLSAGIQMLSGGIVVIVLCLAISHLTSITAGSFISMIAAMMAMLKPIRSLATVNGTIQKGIAAAASVFTLLDKMPETIKQNRSVLKKIKRVQGAIQYQHINFSYQPEQMVLRDINFSVKPGETIALVGRSGSGKSTLVNLLSRFYTGYSGKILIDDIDICDIALDALRDQLALVSQHVMLFNGTIKHNIAYGRLNDVNESAIIRAAELAHAMEFIETLPQGLNTLIGENGVLLSGGQRQRIAIARALLKNAPILILDEATSALDTEAERYIQYAFQTLMQNRTTLVIAHRLSTVEKADKILVLDKGCLIEEGTHQMLLKNNGYYAALYHTQFEFQSKKIVECS